MLFLTLVFIHGSDDVVIAVAMASAHPDVSTKDRLTASQWLQYWDDGSPRFTFLVKRGVERTGCTFDFVHDHH